MKIILNGKEKEFSEKLSIKALVETLDLKPETVIAEINEIIVKKDKWSESLLNDGDKVELVKFVGGG